MPLNTKEKTGTRIRRTLKDKEIAGKVDSKLRLSGLC
jgi:hypothetical protein